MRGLSEIYGAAIFALIAVSSLAALYYVTSMELKASMRLSARLNDFVTISAYYNSSGLCVAVNATQPIKRIIVDQGSEVIEARLGRGESYRGCFAVDAYRPTAILVETVAGLHVYSPGLDPRYRGCAPAVYVFKPYMLEELSSQCMRTADADGDTRLMQVVAGNYLDPVFVAYLGPERAERYRGYLPFRGPVLASKLGLSPGSPVGVVEEPRYTLLNASGLAAVTATAYHPVNVCVYLYDHPAYRDVCRVEKQGFKYVYSYNLSLAEQRRLPVEAWYIVKIPGSARPGAYLVVGDGYVAAGGNRQASASYIEAVVVEPDGSVQVLEWGRVRAAGNGPYIGWIKLSGCTPMSIAYGNVTISTECYALGTGYPYGKNGYMLITHVVFDGLINVTFMQGKGNEGYYYTSIAASPSTVSIVNISYTVAKVDEGLPGTYRVTAMGRNSTLLYSFASPSSTNIFPYWTLGEEAASSSTDSVIIAINETSTVFRKS